MSNLEKIEEMMKNDSTLQEKLAAETRRLTGSGEKDLRKITAEAIKATFGTDLTDEELDQVTDAAAKAATKLDLDELDNVACGRSLGDLVSMVATVGAINGALIGGAVGSAVPVLGTAIGAAAGGAIGAVVGAAGGAVAYVVSDD